MNVVSPSRQAVLGRDPGLLRVRGIVVPDLPTLMAALKRAGDRSRLVAADLSVGAWRPHQAARDIGGQLGLRVPEAVGGVGETARPSSIGQLIDRQTAGDAAVLDALRWAGEVVTALDGPGTVCIVVPERDTAWGREDVFFVRFLARALRGAGQQLVLVSFDAPTPPVPADWAVDWAVMAGRAVGGPPEAPVAASSPGSDLIGLVPGVVEPEVAAAIGGCGVEPHAVRFASGHLLLGPELRRVARRGGEEAYAHLMDACAEFDWLRAYASCCCAGEEADRWLLWRQAADALAAGADQLALRTACRAADLARNQRERAVFVLLVQAARIAHGRFREAAGEPDPDSDLPDLVRGLLWHSKGWALTMAGDRTEAARCLEAAEGLLRMGPDPEHHLFTRNISALNRLRQGDWEGAWRTEQEIRAALERLSAPAWQLRYVNAVNLARLCRRDSRWDEAERWYSEAFDTTAGTRSESDALHAEVARATIDEGAGRHRDAFAAWVRAALVWVSSSAPEAIAPRVISSLLGGGGGGGDRSDTVSLALLRRMVAAAEAGQLRKEAAALRLSDGGHAAAYLLAALVPTANLSGRWEAVVGRRWAVLTSPATPPPVIVSAANVRLRAALDRLLALVARPLSGGEVGLVLVDDQLGTGLPRTEAELVAVGLRIGAGSIVTSSGDQVLGGDERRRRLAALRLQIGRGVDRIEADGEATAVTFRRYLPPRRLTTEEAAIVQHAEAGRSLGDAFAERWSTALAVVRTLEDDRVIELRPGWR